MLRQLACDKVVVTVQLHSGSWLLAKGCGDKLLVLANCCRACSCAVAVAQPSGLCLSALCFALAGLVDLVGPAMTDHGLKQHVLGVMSLKPVAHVRTQAAPDDCMQVCCSSGVRA